MGSCHHCRAEKENLRCSASAALYKSLAVQKCVTSLTLRPRKLPGLIQITDHISYVNMLLSLQQKSGTEQGGAAVPCNFDRRML
jgi:hypothetical protein